MKDKKYSTNYNAIYMREKRKKLVEKDPIYMRKCVWVVTAGDKQIVFKDRKDIKIERISKDKMKPDCIKAF